MKPLQAAPKRMCASCTHFRNPRVCKLMPDGSFNGRCTMNRDVAGKNECWSMGCCDLWHPCEEKEPLK